MVCPTKLRQPETTISHTTYGIVIGSSLMSKYNPSVGTRPRISDGGTPS